MEEQSQQSDNRVLTVFNWILFLSQYGLFSISFYKLVDFFTYIVEIIQTLSLFMLLCYFIIILLLVEFVYVLLIYT